MEKLYIFAVTTLMPALVFAGHRGGGYECFKDCNGGDPVSVPEPSMLGLMATAGVALFLIKRFKKH